MFGLIQVYDPIPGWKPVDRDKNQKIFEELLKIENEGIQNIPKSPIRFLKPGKIGYR